MHLQHCYLSSCSDAVLHPSALIEVQMSSETKKLCLKLLEKNNFHNKDELFKLDVGSASVELLNAVKCISAAPGFVGSGLKLFPLHTCSEAQRH